MTGCLAVCLRVAVVFHIMQRMSLYIFRFAYCFAISLVVYSLLSFGVDVQGLTKLFLSMSFSHTAGEKEMTLYDTIFVRRSVRSYNNDAVSDDVLDMIEDHLDGLTQLKGQNATFRIVPGKKAPYAVLAYCEDGLSEYVNVGYCLQDIDLFLQSLGLGSLWYGSRNPTKNGKDGHCITLAFGNTDVPFRKSEDDFKRMGVNEISNIDNIVARAVRLAPSARNTQPWNLTFEENSVLIEYRGRGMFKALLKKKLSKIDMGIAAKCAELALIRDGKTVKDISVIGNDKEFAVRISY